MLLSWPQDSQWVIRILLLSHQKMRIFSFSKFQYKHADWEAYQAFLLSSDINSLVNDDIDIFYSNFTKTHCY